jgi:hypothetical protein
MPHDWDDFLWSADEWIVNYSLPVMRLTSVKLFSIGHAFELYLKACNSKITGDIERAIKFGHELPRIWKDCKERDRTFLPDYELRDTVLARNLLDHKDYSKLSKDDAIHFLHNQELYVVVKYLADLKYLGAPLKRIKGAYALALFFPNPLWADLFKALRAYLGHPEAGKLDMLQEHISDSQLPQFSVQFLRQIIGA